MLAWALHAAELVYRASPWDLLWTCNLAPLLVAAGCAFGRPVAVAVGVCWLTYGTPMWLLDMLGGGDIMASSFASHLGVLVMGLIATRRLGWPRDSWIAAIAAATVVAALTRLVSPPAHNVNVVFRVWSGWEDHFARHDVYFLLTWAGGAACFLVLERILLRLYPTRHQMSDTE